MRLLPILTLILRGAAGVGSSVSSISHKKFKESLNLAAIPEIKVIYFVLELLKGIANSEENERELDGISNAPSPKNKFYRNWRLFMKMVMGS